ncbi:MAG TPA: arsinothricin resistance N-acetyltransferase ArsN1 family B [Tepidisphaeraceae bacterium]|nr:arsinothricin resistance N-acetyltransferase ArsN1 family B [Tepidisphaeraceae bacterium]
MQLIIRQARLEDGPALADIYRPYVLEAPTSFEEIAPTPQEMSQRVRQTLASWPYLVAEDAGRAIGYVYATSHGARASYRWSVDVSVYIAATHHRRGIGRRLYQQLFPLLVKQGYVMAYAGVTIPNEGSIALHESLGFDMVGIYRNAGYKFGMWRDVGWWELALVNPIPEHPPEPIPWSAMPPFEDLKFDI